MDYETFFLFGQLFNQKNPDFKGLVAIFSEETYAEINLKPTGKPETPVAYEIKGEWMYPRGDKKSLMEKVISKLDV